MKVLYLGLACSVLLGCAKPKQPSVATDEYLADSTCQFVRAQAHPDPSALVTEFVRRDAAGLTLSYQPWSDTATLCPGHTPGPDAFTVVSSYRVAAPLIRGDSATADVSYARLGTTAYDDSGRTTIRLDVRTDTLHYVLARTPFGWRVDSPAILQRVLYDSARRLLAPAAIRQIDSVLGRRH